MELDPLQDAPRLGGRVGFIQGSGRMRVQIVLDDANVVRVRIDFIDQPLDAMGIVEFGAMRRHFHMTPSRERLDEEKQVGRAQPLILVIYSLWLSWLHWLWQAYVCFRRDQFFV